MTCRVARQQPVVIRTIADLGPNVRLLAYCHACRHCSDLDVRELLERYGPLTLIKLRDRLRCSGCGARRPEVQQVFDNVPYRT
jgi:hypothetical protein